MTLRSRWQLGVTITYHFLFVPLIIGLALLVAVMQLLAWPPARRGLGGDSSFGFVSAALLICVKAVDGGLFVALFAVLGEMLQPKRFAGIFGASPAVALANLLVIAPAKGTPPPGTPPPD